MASMSELYQIAQSMADRERNPVADALTQGLMGFQRGKQEAEAENDRAFERIQKIIALRSAVQQYQAEQAQRARAEAELRGKALNTLETGAKDRSASGKFSDMFSGQVRPGSQADKLIRSLESSTTPADAQEFSPASDDFGVEINMNEGKQRITYTRKPKADTRMEEARLRAQEADARRNEAMASYYERRPVPGIPGKSGSGGKSNDLTEKDAYTLLLKYKAEASNDFLSEEEREDAKLMAEHLQARIREIEENKGVRSPAPGSGKTNDPELRKMAMQILKDNKKLVNEETISRWIAEVQQKRQQIPPKK